MIVRETFFAKNNLNVLTISTGAHKYSKLAKLKPNYLLGIDWLMRNLAALYLKL